MNNSKGHSNSVIKINDKPLKIFTNSNNSKVSYMRQDKYMIY